MKKPYTVGIAGGSASGKSTFAGALEKALLDLGLDVLVFHMDSYFKPKGERPYVEAPMANAMYVDDNHPLTADLPKLANDLDKAIEENSRDVIIIEGLLTLWEKSIYSRLDLKLYADCGADERIVRRLKRNLSRGLSFDEIANVYLDLVRYRHDEYVEPTKWRADFILNGSSPSEKALAIISEAVRTAVVGFQTGTDIKYN